MTPEQLTGFAQDLFAAILAVNGLSTAHTVPIAAALLGRGFRTLQDFGAMDVDELAVLLDRAGYKRGYFMTHLLASRLIAAAQALTSADIEAYDLGAIATQSVDDTFVSFLRSIPGVGPHVLNNLATLRVAND